MAIRQPGTVAAPAEVREVLPVDSADPVTTLGFRTLMSGFPSGVAVVCAVDQQQRPHGMTCTSLCSVTVDPPTLLVSLQVASGTLHALRERGSFTLNLLHAQGQGTAELFASRDPDRFGRATWQPSPVVGAPWLTEAAFALAECRVSQLVPVGDHTLVIGAVVNIQQRPDTPLLYGLRQFASWPGHAG
ncbi:flavin reductase family protein [Natronosporangium hydrolyticum]|uniref:Flavin reductase family protein n=1 Tax=Natronosporangium hydrolyticum TaxID=2811111 RepID=A0A895YEN0_9ACTN|nr:flavin reductase family protein [Natronosporangium hydrolyticum]QSB16314.1 flavin reductase family protein [Natronosporangium hydrolyticum]